VEPTTSITRPQRKPSLLLALLVGVSILVVPSMALFQYLAKSHPVYGKSLDLLRSHGDVRRRLGEPLRPSLWTYARVARRSGSWRFSVAGPRGRAGVIVSATRRDGGWYVEYIFLKPEGGERMTSLELPADRRASDAD
jgi:hypothetical protein